VAGQVATTTDRRRGLLLPALAVIGAGFVAFQLFGFLAWAIAADAPRFEVDVAIPDSARAGVLLGQLLMPAVAVGWLTFVILGVRRMRTLTWPALLTAAWGLTWWQESLVNVTGPRFAYNAAFVDLGDWTPYLPFVTDAGPGLPQPLVMQSAVWVGLLPLVSWTAAAAMRALRARTRIPTWGVIALVYVGVLVFELAAEMRSIAQGVHSYPEVFGALSIRAGAADQFPLYENWLLGLMWFLPGLVIFLIRDRAEQPAAVPPLPRSGAVGVATVVLAAAGALNLVFLAYNLIAFVWLPADTTAPMPPWLNP
jgi:hypothetical protein